MKNHLSNFFAGAMIWIVATAVIIVGAVADFGYNIARLLGVIRDLAEDIFVVVTISIPPALAIWLIVWVCGEI